MEDNLQLKTTFGGRRSSMEDNLRRKRTFCRRQPLVEEDLRWKTNFRGRRTLVEDNLQWILACCLVHFAEFFLPEIFCTINSFGSIMFQPRIF